MESTAQQVGVRELLEAGVHFGHQAKRWNPKMKKYIFAERAGVHIVDLDQTIKLLDRARKFVRSVGESGRSVLFVGTKKQAQLTIAEQALRCGQPYVAERYIGGMLTNFQTIYSRIQYFKDLAARVEETPEEERSGKEWFAVAREYQKLRRNFAGITEMERVPGAVFVVDPKREELMVKEANRLKIPVVALTDTNCDPDVIDYIIPGNDDAIRSINMITRLMADAVIEGAGEDITPAADRPLPPAVEDTLIAEEMSEGTVEEVGGNGTAQAAVATPESPSSDNGGKETGGEQAGEIENPSAGEPSEETEAAAEDEKGESER